VLWKPPFRVDVTAAVRSGTNRLEIEVTNLWPNRMIGDQKLPVEQRIAWATYNPFKAGSPLLPSGLLGPVVIRAAAQVGLR
jgi:(4-O-methyl)-D-glucuronate---lignin esterase